jgi:hypothetical protein
MVIRIRLQRYFNLRQQGKTKDANQHEGHNADRDQRHWQVKMLGAATRDLQADSNQDERQERRSQHADQPIDERRRDLSDASATAQFSGKAAGLGQRIERL